MVQGAKYIAQGILGNRSLLSLNIKGNVIGDQGITLIAGALREVPQLNQLDISLNEIGPTGFQALCEVLPFTGLTTLVCNKNFLGDEIVGYFA